MEESSKISANSSLLESNNEETTFLKVDTYVIDLGYDFCVCPKRKTYLNSLSYRLLHLMSHQAKVQT